MMRRTIVRWSGSLLVAGLALVLTSSSALAVVWGPDVKLSSTATSDHELVRTGPAQAIAVWLRTSTLIARRTSDGGRTWLPSQTLATHVGLGIGVTASGQNVNVVYPVSTACSAGGVASRLYERHSSNGGATWSIPRPLTSACSRVAEPDVARSPDGQVSAVWTGLETGRILMRTSRDGGATFGPAVQVATTTNRVSDAGGGRASCCFTAWPAVAVGSSGTTYMSYTAAPGRLAIRRSVNFGASWSVATTLTSASVTDRASIVATGSRAAIAYTASLGRFRAVDRTTADRGANWSSPRDVVAQSGREFSIRPELAIDGGVLGVIVKFGTPGASPIWYRQSPNWGLSWSATIRISPAPHSGLDPDPAGLAILGGVVLAGHAENGATAGFWVRQGTR